MQAFLVLGMIIHIKLGVICLAHTRVDNDFISHISITMTMTKSNFQKKMFWFMAPKKGFIIAVESWQQAIVATAESMKQKSERRL